MNISNIAKAAGGRISFVSLPVVVGLQMLWPPEAGPGAGTTLLADHNVMVLGLCVIWLALLALIEHWHRDDRKEANRIICHTENGVTESRYYFKGYDEETILELFRENGTHDGGVSNSVGH